MRTCCSTPGAEFGLLEAIIFRLYRQILLRSSWNAGSNSRCAGEGYALAAGVGSDGSLLQGCLT